MTLLIGPSTGWLYARGVNSMETQNFVLRGTGANAVELFMGTGLDRHDVRVASALSGQRVECSEYTSLHLPDYREGADANAHVSVIRELVARHLVKNLVIHPLKINGEYPIAYYEALKASRRCLSVENMDRNKPSGFALAELEQLVHGRGLGFVLDIQHAYEHDPTMKYASDLLASMGHALVHLHVSGETENSNHCLLHRARNVNALVGFLGEVFAQLGADQPCPIILEGEFRTVKDLRAEIEFIRKEVGKDVVRRLREDVDIAQGHQLDRNFQDRQAIVEQRRELIDEMCFNSPAQIATNLGPAPEEEYQAYLDRYERMRNELAALNKLIGLPEGSMALLAE